MLNYQRVSHQKLHEDTIKTRLSPYVVGEILILVIQSPDL